MEHLGHPFSLYDLAPEAQAAAMGWWLAREARAAGVPKAADGTTGDPALDQFYREFGKE